MPKTYNLQHMDSLSLLYTHWWTEKSFAASCQPRYEVITVKLIVKSFSFLVKTFSEIWEIKVYFSATHSLIIFHLLYIRVEENYLSSMNTKLITITMISLDKLYVYLIFTKLNRIFANCDFLKDILLQWYPWFFLTFI